jgi:hypothetical protein
MYDSAADGLTASKSEAHLSRADAVSEVLPSAASSMERLEN